MNGFHSKPLGDKAEKALASLQSAIQYQDKLQPKPPKCQVGEIDISNIRLPSPPCYSMGETVPLRNVYGTALAKLGHANSRVIALDGDMKNSTFSEKFKVFHTLFISMHGELIFFAIKKVFHTLSISINAW